MSAEVLKEALLECLEGSLSPNGSIRKEAEERLKALEATEKFGLDLLEVILNQNYSSPLRQLAAVLLRRYVENFWSPDPDKYVIPEPSQEVKTKIRDLLPSALLDSDSKVYNSTASVISKIAVSDWPEFWPGLFPILMNTIKNPTGVNGSMRALTEVVKEITDEQVNQLIPIILPEMLRILNDKLSYSVDTRACAVDIFRSISLLINSLGLMSNKSLSSFLEPCLEHFLKEFVSILEETDSQYTSYSLQKTIVRAITYLLRNVPKRLSPYLQFILKPIWSILTTNHEEFNKYLIGESDEGETDAEGETCGVDSLIFAVFGLIQTLFDVPALLPITQPWLPDLIFYTIYYMQLPQERVESWISSPAEFAVDEDEDGAPYTLRLCAQDVLTIACEQCGDEFYSALGQAVDRHLQGATDWRLQESCLFAVSSLGTRIVKPQRENCADPEVVLPQSFNIYAFLQNVVFPGLSSPDILLAGRCLVLGSNLCTVLTPDLIRRFVQGAAELIVNQERSVISKILASKALATFVEQARDNLTVKMALLEVIPSIIDAFIAFTATQPVEVSGNCLETLAEILSLDEGLTSAIGQRMTTLAIACLVKFIGDPHIITIVEDIVKALANNSECVVGVQERLTPTLMSLLSRGGEGGGGQGVALDMLAVLVRASPTPLSPLLMAEAFPLVLLQVTGSDDQTVLQNGGECLRAYVSKDPLQVYEFHDAQGNSGLGHVVKMACRLLDPTTPEFSASFAGKLVTTLIVKTGDRLGDQLELLLRAVLSKLQSADTLSVIQNLCMVYAHLINTQMEAAISFLLSVPGPTGQSALHFVMTEWVSRQQFFYGLYDRKVSAVALSKLLQQGVVQNDTRLAQISVNGDPIVDINASRRTRSRAGQAEQWTIVPLLVKIFKLLIHELSSVCLDSTLEEEESDEDGEEENKENYLGDGIFDEDEVYGEEDADVLSDPLYNLDLEKYLKEFLKEFSTHAYYLEFLSHLNVVEKKILKSADIPC